jgi:hypothetical protein
MILDIIAASDTIVALVILLVALLTSTPVMLREEHLWKFCVIERVHISSLVIL